MMIRLISIGVLVTLFAVDGEKDGRRGNELYAQDQFDLAAEAYESGITSLAADAPALLRYGLLNNLGAALLKAGDVERSGEVFARALDSAPEAADVARTTYNAGNAAFAASDLEAALAQYRKSLLTDPDNEDAKYNYEYVKRQLEQQQQQQQDGRQDEDQESEEQEQEDGEQEPDEGDQDQQGNEQEQEDETQGQEGQDEQEQDSAGEGQDELNQEENLQSEPQAQPSPNELSEEEAQRILQALQNEEEQLLRQVQRPNSEARDVEKDW